MEKDLPYLNKTIKENNMNLFQNQSNCLVLNHKQVPRLMTLNHRFNLQYRSSTDHTGTLPVICLLFSNSLLW